MLWKLIKRYKYYNLRRLRANALVSYFETLKLLNLEYICRLIVALRRLREI